MRDFGIEVQLYTHCIIIDTAETAILPRKL